MSEMMPQESPFATVMIQADVYELASKSSAGKEQLRMFYKGCGWAPQTGQGAVPVPTPFANPPEHLSPAGPLVHPPRPQAPLASVPTWRAKADGDLGERSINWGIAKQMGSSVEDILSSINRLAGGKRVNEQLDAASNQGQPDRA